MNLPTGRLPWALVVLLSGGLLPFALSPFDIWPLAFLSIALWFYTLHMRVLPAWLSGWLYGVGKYGVGVSWIYGSIHEFGGETVLVAGLLVALFVAAMALFTMVQSVAFQMARGTTLLADSLSFIATWVLGEWLLTWLFTGFPWLFPGYAMLDTPWVSYAPIGGVMLVSTLVVTSACVLVGLFLTRSRILLALAVGLPWLVAVGLGLITWVEAVGSRTAVLVQGNVAQATKWLPENRAPILRRYLALSDPHWDADVLVWPEAAITYYHYEAGPVLDTLRQRAAPAGTSVVMGIPSVDFLPGGEYELHNSAIALGAGEGKYLKRRLVPFGEYVPLERSLRGVIAFFDLPMSGATPGPMDQPPLVLGDLKAAMAICYEVVYAEMLRAQAGESDVLITVTNDTWFGSSIGPWQHMQMARMRAAENGRWLLRGTNNGVSVIVDHLGVIRHTMPQFEQGVVRGQFEVMKGRTPYNAVGHGWLVAFATVLWLLLLLYRRTTRPGA
jgi:apolipoprotein N-acyltransferase